MKRDFAVWQLLDIFFEQKKKKKSETKLIFEQTKAVSLLISFQKRKITCHNEKQGVIMCSVYSILKSLIPAAKR